MQSAVPATEIEQRVDIGVEARADHPAGDHVMVAAVDVGILNLTNYKPPAPDDSYWAFSRRIADYDPLVWWRQVDVPVLLVYGAADERVPVEPSVAAITEALESSGHSATVRIFEGADHTFRLHRPGDEWPRTAPGYPDAVLEWLANL